MTPAQCRAARALLGWKQIDLGKKAGTKSHMPVFYYEKYENETRMTGTYEGARYVSLDTVDRMRAALEKAGIEFIGTTGVDLK